MYQRVQQLFIILYGAIAASFLFSILLFASTPLLGLLAIVIGVVIGGAVFYVRGMIYSLESFNAYEVSFVKREGKSIDMRLTNHLLKNLLYMLAIQYPNKRASILVTAANQYKPILLTAIKKDTLTDMVNNEKELSQVVFRFKEIDSQAVKLYLGGNKTFLAVLNQKNITKESTPINLSETLKAGDGAFLGAYLNLCYMPRFSPEVIGNVAVVVDKNAIQGKEQLDLLNILNETLTGVERILLNVQHPFVKLYNGVLRSLVQLIISDDLIERVDVVRFPPVPNVIDPVYDHVTLKAVTPKTAWVVAASGERNDSPVYLRNRLLVVQDFVGLSNPAVVWASNMIPHSSEAFAIVDFSTATTSLRGLNNDMVMSRQLAVIAAPSETPEYFINLLSLWPGIAENHRPMMTGVLLRYLEKFVRYSFAESSKADQDRMVTIMQGSFLLLIAQNLEHDLVGFVSAMNEIPTIMMFLGRVHDAMSTLVYNSQLAGESIIQVWATMNNLGVEVDYSKTLAANAPTSADLQIFNALKRKLSGLLDETGNIILSNGQSRYNLTNFHGVLFDASKWEGNVSSLFLEHLLAGVQYYQMIRESMNVPTNILIHGIGALKPDAQRIALAILDEYLRTYNGRGKIIVADTEILDGYANIIKRRGFQDVYIFQTKNVGQMADLLSRIKITDSIYTLPRQHGYILRMSEDKKIVPGNIFTAKPQLVSVK